ncbi:DUF6509 family protein [Bacillus andreraoultii]|uniref:DUF6509 family protein n=1 Tax=Bacillus andreraoultii TaxID=1499685 RepID=UPI00053AB7CA|nr:DUF6509 family protein [Bacillus andreraoultii]
MEIKDYHVEKLEDPTGILVGDRYEFILDIDVDEDDELYSDNGLYIKLIMAVDKETTRIVQYQIYERTTDIYLDFALDEEEEEMILEFCKEKIV